MLGFKKTEAAPNSDDDELCDLLGKLTIKKAAPKDIETDELCLLLDKMTLSLEAENRARARRRKGHNKSLPVIASSYKNSRRYRKTYIEHVNEEEEAEHRLYQPVTDDNVRITWDDDDPEACHLHLSIDKYDLRSIRITDKVQISCERISDWILRATVINNPIRADLGNFTV